MSSSPVIDQQDPVKAVSTFESYPEIEMTDSNDELGLKMYCFKEGVTESSDPFVLSTRGTVTHNGTVVMKTFGYTPEYSDQDASKISTRTNGEDFNEYLILESKEGALIRLFYLQEKWHICTHRKLDAYRSRWSSKESFGQIFERGVVGFFRSHPEHLAKLFSPHLSASTQGSTSTLAASTSGLPTTTSTDSELFSAFLGGLDKTWCHTFLVSNTKQNRIVCDAPDTPSVDYVGSFSPDGEQCTFLDSLIPCPDRLPVFSVTELVEYVRNVPPKRAQGVFVMTPNGYFKVTSTAYKNLYNLRGNCSSVKFRYLQLRTIGPKAADFTALYPDHMDTFRDYEETISAISRDVHAAYINRFIKKQYTVVSPDEYAIIKICHGRHIQDRNYKVTLDRVYEVLTNSDPVMLNRMIKNKKNPKPLIDPRAGSSSSQAEQPVETPQ